MNEAILPGATIGVIGSGQLGRMFAMAARRLGYLVHTFSPETDTPTGQIADVEITAAYTDHDAVRRFARGINVATFEFENIPATTAEIIAEYVPVRPSGAVLHTTQHRLREKTFLTHAGFPVAPFRAICSFDNLRNGLDELGYPAVLKTAGWGYDGKGQRTINSFDEAEKAFQTLAGGEAVLEKFIDFEREISVVAVRSLNGNCVHYGVIENNHRRHILDTSLAPAAVPHDVWQVATEMALSLLEKLDVVGVLCVEFFLAKNGKLYINELAPRPHNSGHFTVDACLTSQFEQQLRAVCGLPLGATTLVRPAAAMANLLGDLWLEGELDWQAAYAFPEVKLHLYGKHTPRAGRKMGHLTALGATTNEVLQLVCSARDALTRHR